jgi:hypothetical protein
MSRIGCGDTDSLIAQRSTGAVDFGSAFANIVPHDAVGAFRPGRWGSVGDRLVGRFGSGETPWKAASLLFRN